MEKRPKSFVLYADFEGALLKLPLKDRGILFTMIYSYAKRGEIDEKLKIAPATEMAFEIIRAQLDRDMEKYERICIRNAENGKFGGRPRDETDEKITQKTQWVFEKPKKAYNKNNNNNNNKNNTNNNNNNMRSFDADDFFAAALARSYGETDREKEDI